MIENDPDGLRDLALRGGSSLLDKLASLTDDEWSELTRRMAKLFQDELDRRGYVIVKDDPDL